MEGPALAAERGVRVVRVCPGITNTSAIDDATAKIVEGSGLPWAAAGEALLAAVGQIPLGHPGKPEDVAELVAFLLSDNAAHITGVQYVIDGGMQHAMS